VGFIAIFEQFSLGGHQDRLASKFFCSQAESTPANAANPVRWAALSVWAGFVDMSKDVIRDLHG